MALKDRGENAEQRPPAGLRSQLIRYRGYRTPGAQPPRVTLPAARVTLLLGWGEPLHIHGGSNRSGAVEHWSSMLAGPQSAPFLAGYQGAGYAIEVEFTPLGAHMCLGLPLHHLADAVLHPDDVMGAGWTARITERIAVAPDWHTRWAIINSTLTKQLADSPPVPPVVIEAWHALWSNHGALTTRELTQRSGRGSRRLQTLFREYIGIPPQTLSRIIRFQYALKIPSQGYQSLAELAAISGYHDQAHMNRDFRALAGRTPGQLRPLADRATLAGGTGHDSCFTDFFAGRAQLPRGYASPGTPPPRCGPAGQASPPVRPEAAGRHRPPPPPTPGPVRRTSTP
ncbi:helix-turn-helix domain-containing protein [Streptomyces sp. NPDC052164]|uniref:helix-turn-helix domain-containing protein n=1 Tax=Streptomyces sp. NPDC052164 TaxID=3155529 RepID=UPI00341694A5